MNSIFTFNYRSEVLINATKEEVWKVLTDTKSYPEWNPHTIRVDTSWETGSDVFLSVKMSPDSKPMLYTMHLNKLEPMNLISWNNKSLHIQVLRNQTLENLSDSITKYRIEQTIKGSLSPIAHLIFSRSIQKSFDNLAHALKDYVEGNIQK